MLGVVLVKSFWIALPPTDFSNRPIPPSKCVRVHSPEATLPPTTPAALASHRAVFLYHLHNIIFSLLPHRSSRLFNNNGLSSSRFSPRRWCRTTRARSFPRPRDLDDFASGVTRRRSRSPGGTGLGTTADHSLFFHD